MSPIKLLKKLIPINWTKCIRKNKTSGISYRPFVSCAPGLEHLWIARINH